MLVRGVQYTTCTSEHTRRDASRRVRKGEQIRALLNKAGRNKQARIHVGETGGDVRGGAVRSLPSIRFRKD